MALRDQHFPSVMTTSTHNLIEELFVPAFSQSIQYDRGVGYFSSGWLKMASAGMVAFATNEGRARWITSPILSNEDWHALQTGDAARTDPIIHEQIQRTIEDLEDALERDTRSALAWMVADRIIDFRLALPRNRLEGGDFHDKFGIFTDVFGNQISFNGSYNDSIQGLRNYESLKIFRSWDPSLADLVQSDAERFELIWQNADANVATFDLSEAAREGILQLRSYDRPYPRPSWIEEDKKPVDIRRKLWQHQTDAITAWEKSERRGLLVMATGSGKTITALAAAEGCPNPSIIVIAVPRMALVDQWAHELSVNTNLPTPTLVYESSESWQDSLVNRLWAAQASGWKKPVVIIGTLASLSGKRFESVITEVGIADKSLLIADEVHNTGAPTYQKVLRQEYSWRLGLSATPSRPFDEQGSSAISIFFGSIVFEYGLNQALIDGHLTPYVYKIFPAPLSEDEFAEYVGLTQKISRLRGKGDNSAITWQTQNALDNDSKQIEQMLFRRARILKKCAAKFDALQAVLRSHKLSRCLIYCADQEQLQEVCDFLRATDLIYLTYTAETSKEKRQAALSALRRGTIQALVAIDCLDEGIDVPVVDQALILASSSNKRQFIQRRGRILRRAEGKTMATLLDVIVVPPQSAGQSAKWMLGGELARAKEMSELADNRTESLLRIKEITRRYGILLTELLNEEGNG